MTKHKLKQADAAGLLGVSQPAISLYSRKIRGSAIDLESEPEVRKKIEDFADALAEDDLSPKEFMSAFCEICKTVRARKMLCSLHKSFDSSVNLENCELCSIEDLVRCR
jgi:predicted transcriptional regulator